MSEAADSTRHGRLDGNAAAGVLREVFTVDLTAATSTCGACGSSAALAAHRVYADAPALVVRCPSCEAVVLRCGERGAQVVLDLSGVRLLVVDLPPG